MCVQGTVFASVRRSALLYPILAMTCLLAGCLPSTQTGPPRIFAVDDEAANIKSQFQLPNFSQYATLSESDKIEYRDTLITARMYGIDLEFSKYELALTRERQDVSFAGDVTNIGLTSAVPLVGAVATKNILGTTASGLTGVKTAYSDDVLMNRTVQILQTQMEASRAKVAAHILTHIGSSSAKYPLATALSDLEDYYRAGTITGALIDVSTTVSNDVQDERAAKDQALPPQLRTLGTSTTTLPQPSLHPDFNNLGLSPSERQVGPNQLANYQARLFCVSNTKQFDGPTREAMGKFFVGFLSAYKMDPTHKNANLVLWLDSKSALTPAGRIVLENAYQQWQSQGSCQGAFNDPSKIGAATGF
jgi:hypothetical protein